MADTLQMVLGVGYGFWARGSTEVTGNDRPEVVCRSIP